MENLVRWLKVRFAKKDEVFLTAMCDVPYPKLIWKHL